MDLIICPADIMVRREQGKCELELVLLRLIARLNIDLDIYKAGFSDRRISTQDQATRCYG